MIRISLSIALTLAALPAPVRDLAAQAPPRTWVRPVHPALQRSSLDQAGAPRDSVPLPRTRWKEGAIIGGAVLGSLALMFSLVACSDTDSVDESDRTGCVLGTTAVSALLGAMLGALIGGQVRAGEATAPAG
ncbi:MAG TPA: hypothetical protein VJ773_11560 [Gemmatimonadales bacterium]|nr:hypothetical protein [Gemmatimonadales bacterium]